MSYNPRGRGDRGGYSPRGGSDGRGRGRGTFDVVDRSRGGGGGGGRGGPEFRGRGGPEFRGRGGGPDRGGRGGGYDRPRGGGREPQVSQEVLFEGRAVLPSNVGPFEDSCVAYNKEHRKPDAALPFRPDYGTKGRPIVLRANFHEISFQDTAKFYSYRIALKPDNGPRRDTKRVFWKLMNESPFKDLIPTTDGSTEIVTLRRLAQVKDIEVFLDMEGNGRGDGHGANLRKKYTVKITEGGMVDQARLLNDLRNKTVQGKIVDEDVTIRALNIVMAKQPYNDEGTVITGKTRNKYFWIDDRKQSSNLGGGLECIRGFYSSVRLSAGRILLNLNVNHSAFFAAGNLSQLIQDFWRVFGPDNQLLNRYIKGVRVEITHLPKVKNEKGELAYRQKSIWGLATVSDGRKGPNPPMNPPKVKDFGANPDGVMFLVQGNDDKSGKSGKPTGQWVTVGQYFNNQYGMKLGNFPVVNTGSLDKPTYQPVDVCRILPGQICNGELGTSQRQAIIGFSCRRPPDNYMTIKTNGLKMIGSTDAMGLRVLPELVAVPGRVLNAPTLRYKTKSETPRFGSWNLRGQVFCKGVTVSSWGVLVLHTAPTAPEPSQAVELLQRISNGLGLNFTSKPRTMNVPLSQPQKDPNAPPPPSLRTKLDTLFSRAKANGFQFALVLLPNSDEGVFSDVKYAGDVKHGLLTHCCLTDKFTKGNDQYMANNAMKINLKLGGVNQTLDQPRTSRLIDAGKTMVVGLDVTHPSATDPPEFPSIACIVASIDKQLGQWPGEAQVQGKKVEKIEKLPAMLKSCLVRWREANNQQLPENILVYRDGVSEGQFEMVAKEEYEDMRIATGAMYRKPPPITIIVCGKRHNVRFFPTAKGDVDRTSNPLNGTVVDRGVTRPILWDFYLQAQSPLQGSARPAHYVVVRDEIFNNPRIVTEGRPSDVVQELTHSICYMMGRCTRSISYSTPAFLADRFCDRARRYIRSDFKRQSDLEKEDARVNRRAVDIRLTTNPEMVQIHNTITNRMVYI